MTNPIFKKTTRFFQSFNASTIPVVPIGEMDESEIRPNTSFYATDFGEEGHLVRCRKYFASKTGGLQECELVFDDEYSYSNEGLLEARTLTRDGKEKRWFFEVNDHGLTRDFAQLSNELTEFEYHCSSELRSSDIAYDERTRRQIHDYLASSQQSFRTATHDPRARVLLLIPRDERTWSQLHPTNVFESDLGDIATLLKPKILIDDETLPATYPAPSSFPREFEYLQSGVRALSAHPVRVKERKETRFGVVALVAYRTWTAAMSEQVTQSLKRICTFVELLIELRNKMEGASRDENNARNTD